MQINIRITEAQKELLKKEAKKNGMTMTTMFKYSVKKVFNINLI